MIVDLSISEKYKGMLVTERTEASSAEPVAMKAHLYNNTKKCSVGKHLQVLALLNSLL